MDKFASNSDKDAEFDWMEPSLHLSNPRMLQPNRYDGVYDAFHLLQTEPIVQVPSSTKLIAENNGLESSDDSSDNSNPAINVIMCIFDNTKAKVMEVIEKITTVVNELFKPPDDGKAATGAATAGATNPFEEKLRTSFLLSIVVLLVVVVT